jgi:DNA-binding transcriptional LysR family regulator
MNNIIISDSDPAVKLDWLRSFLAVADQGGFSRAARALHMSQPAISTHVKELEENLGTRLFEKIGGKISLSPSGEAVAAEARGVLEGVRRLREAAARSETEVRGTLAVGASTTPGNYLLPPLLGEFERRHPGAHTVLRIGNSARILELLSRNEVDLGVVGIAPSGRDIVGTPVWRDEIVVFARADHPLARARREVPLSELAGHRLILREADSATRRLADDVLSRGRVRPTILELGSPETVKRAVAAGLGLGVLSAHAIGAGAGEREFREIRVPGFPIRRPLYAVRLRRKRLTRTLSAFLEMLEKNA